MSARRRAKGEPAARYPRFGSLWAWIELGALALPAVVQADASLPPARSGADAAAKKPPVAVPAVKGGKTPQVIRPIEPGRVFRPVEPGRAIESVHLGGAVAVTVRPAPPLPAPPRPIQRPSAPALKGGPPRPEPQPRKGPEESTRPAPAGKQAAPTPPCESDRDAPIPTALYIHPHDPGEPCLPLHTVRLRLPVLPA